MLQDQINPPPLPPPTQPPTTLQITTAPLSTMHTPVIITTGYIPNDLENHQNIAISQWAATTPSQATNVYITSHHPHVQYSHYEYAFTPTNGGAYIPWPLNQATYSVIPTSGSDTYNSYHHQHHHSTTLNDSNSYKNSNHKKAYHSNHRNGFTNDQYHYDQNNNYFPTAQQQTNLSHRKKNNNKESTNSNDQQQQKKITIKLDETNNENKNENQINNTNLKKKWSEVVSGNDKNEVQENNGDSNETDDLDEVDHENQIIYSNDPETYYNSGYNQHHHNSRYNYNHQYAATYDPTTYYQNSYYDTTQMNQYYPADLFSFNLHHLMPLTNQHHHSLVNNVNKGVNFKKYDYTLKNYNNAGYTRSYFKQRNNNSNNNNNSNSSNNNINQLNSDNIYSKYNPSDFSFNNGENNNSNKKSRCFVIKSYSAEDVVHSIKHGIWCSTEQGNLKLDDAYNQVKKFNLSVYLFFSVNGSGQFCGMAEMLSNVDYTSSASHIWTQDKWKGQFKVNWIFVKDVPNTKLKHVIMPNNENKPVTNSRDTQEILYEQALLVLDVFNKCELKTSILDIDYYEYDDEENNNEENNNLEQTGDANEYHNNNNNNNNKNNYGRRYYYNQNYYNSNRTVHNNKTNYHNSRFYKSSSNKSSSSSVSSNRNNTNNNINNKNVNKFNNGAQKE